MNEEEPKPSRLRTRRACDYCREHRIRCEYIEPYDTSGDCKHCRRYGILCKKAARAPRDSRPRAARSIDPTIELEKSSHQGIEPGYLGPSNVSQQIRDQCLLSPNGVVKLENLEDRLDVYNNAFEDNQNRGRLVGRHPEIGETARRKAAAAITYSRVETRLFMKLGSETILDDLMTTCRHTFLPLYPAVSVHESLGPTGPSSDFDAFFGNFHFNSTPPTALPPVFRLIFCSIPAMSRNVPVDVREALLSAINTALDTMEYSLSMESLTNLQLLLLLSVNDEIWKKGPMGKAIYTATRMATGLALHRNVSTRLAPFAQVQRRARIWGACIIGDRWTTLRMGQMPSIDLSYADAAFPSPYPDHLATDHPGVKPCFRFHAEMTKLADLLGRAYHISSIPGGLEKTNNFVLLTWQLDYQAWQAQLPDAWPYSQHLDTPQARQILDLLQVAVLYTFTQPFIWPTQAIPDHVTYRPPQSFQEELIRYSGESVKWACGVGSFYLDIWSLLLHPFVCCLIVQAKAAQMGDFTAGLILDRGIEVIRDWAKHGESPSWMAIKRADMVELVELLKEQEAPEVSWSALSDLV